MHIFNNSAEINSQLFRNQQNDQRQQGSQGGGNGKILASFWELPALARPKAETVIKELEVAGVRGLAILGMTSEPVCEIPVALNKVGMILTDGLEGIEKEYEVPDPIEENVYEMTEEGRRKRGIGTLPASLWEAIQLTEKSEVVRRALGDHIFDAFIKNKKIEWDQYRTQVTGYELERYLPIL